MQGKMLRIASYLAPFLFGVCGLHGASTSPSGRLELAQLGDDAVEGAFVDPEAGRGIRVYGSTDSLYIVDLDGNPIVIAEEAVGSFRLIQIGEDAFLQHTAGDWDYTIPKMYVYLLRACDLEPSVVGPLVSKLQEQGREFHQQKLQASLAKLLARPEVELIESAVFALGEEKQVTGQEFPIVLPFYMTAIELKKLQRMNLPGSNKSDQARSVMSVSYHSRLRRKVDGLYADSCLDECPPCPDDECLGMCGPGCTCWSFVCGDCCYHLGCYDHDVCCREKFIRTKCLLPFSFKCEYNYKCNSTSAT